MFELLVKARFLSTAIVIGLIVSAAMFGFSIALKLISFDH